MNSRTIVIGLAVVVGATFLVVGIRHSFHEWNIDLSNTAWGAIVAALISSVIGVVMKFAMDARLAALQGDVQKKVNIAIEEERTRLQEGLTALKASLDDRNSASAARRDYEYEARKRLYDEVEPLLFQVYEALEEAHFRVRSLARTARDGNLSWLEGDGYYLASTVYKLLLPVAHLRLIQQRMTFVDLGLDPHIEIRYLLLKMYARSFTDDFIFARVEPRLQYDPNNVEWRHLREKDAAVYARQALVVGDLECIADLLINSDGAKSRAISYGEFEVMLGKTPVDRNLQEAIALFRGFSPERKPVLARMLVAQGCLSRFIWSIYHAGDAVGPLRQRYNGVVDDVLCDEMRWGANREDGTGVAAAYWGTKLDMLGSEIYSRRVRAV